MEVDEGRLEEGWIFGRWLIWNEEKETIEWEEEENSEGMRHSETEYMDKNPDEEINN